ncbi:MAG TPA: penicillin-binding protein activator [Verrucomicrobiae bacterium]|nr:penicillin-binding protein activator [Verrucomicrobiae bacterium]
MPLSRISLAALVFAVAACAAPRGGTPALAASAGDNEAVLAAAEAQLARGDAGDAREALSGIAANLLDARQRVRLQLVQAEIFLAENKPLDALQALPTAGTLRDPDLAIRAEGDRAGALFQMGDAIGATRTMVQREKLLTDPAQRAVNREQLWNSLRMTELDSASGLRLQQADPVTRGWVELAVISRSVWLDRRDLEARREEWRANFKGHPGEDRLGTLTAAAASVVPGRNAGAIALLLPLGSSLTASAEAVRDGFFASFYAARDDAGARPAARVYDTGTTPDTLLAAYRKALDDGAEFIVGPLRREDVAVLASQGQPAVPVLALNYLDPGTTAPFNFFQWGLAPEDEARQAAERAIMDRQYRAVALVPEGDWGARVLAAFRERLNGLGGALVGERTYVATERDHSDAIRNLLSLDASESRHHALTNVLGKKTEFQPRRREDVDLVFIAARPEAARLIGPQLRFHRTGDLPIYATSLVYEGDAPAADLQGLRFCDMSWMLSTDGPHAATRAQLQALFPTRPKEHARLLALGHDAYTLVRLIESGQLAPGSFFPAATGTLSLREDRVISRGLTCAEVRNGTLKPLDVNLPPR